MTNTEIIVGLNSIATKYGYGQGAEPFTDDEWNAIGFAKEIINDYARLTAEVAELRARLEKAVELPVKMGDWVYCITDNRIIGGEVSEIHIEEFNTTITFVRYDFDGEYIGEWYIYLENYNKTWFTTRAEAEARLKESQGGER